MFFTDRKLEARLYELASYRYRDIIPFESLFAKEDTAGVSNPEIPTSDACWDLMAVGERWSGRDRYLWLRKTMSVPKVWEGKKIVGIFDFGSTGGGNNSGFESMLYIEGKPYQGVDSNHKEAFFDSNYAGKDLELVFRLWSGLEGGGNPTPQEHRINRADLAWLDEKVDDLFFMTRVILETLKVLNEFDPVVPQLRMALDKAYKLIDWSYPGSEAFYESVHAADDLLNELIDNMDKNSLVKVKCVGHTHIDVAWLWRLKHTREKCARSFSTVLRLMEQYPEYTFLQTQPQLYEYIKEDYPEMFEKIKAKVKEGNWEADGGMWVEADCNLTSGESLTRQILVGSKFFREELGQEIKYLWLPDVFGYSWALPQILKKSGIPMFMTTKISWNQYNRMPHDTFKWRGMDGSEVLTHFITAPEPWSQPGSWFYTYNGHLTPKIVKGVYDAYSDKNLTDELLISFGYGDGGGGVNRDMLEYRRRVDKMPGLPSLETSKAADYFKGLREKIENTDEYVHTWDGELYLEYHRGTYTSQAYNKKMNRYLENYYRNVEWLTAMDAINKGDIKEAKQDELTEGWKIILTHQFHDIIPGSSINEVYKDSHVNYEKAEAVAKEIEQSVFTNIMGAEESTWTVINNTNWERSDYAHIVTEAKGQFVDEAGNVLKAQETHNGYVVYVDNIPAMGWKVIKLVDNTSNSVENTTNVFTFADGIIETPFYHVELNEVGHMTSLVDKKADRQVLAKGAKANVIQMFEDKPLAHEAWDIDIYYQEKMREVTDLTRMEVTEKGPLHMVVRLEWNYMNTKIKQDMTFYVEDKRIDFKTWVDFRERKQLMKVAFPVDIRSTYATYDVQYGNVQRPTHWNTSWDWARFETVAHKWVDLSERNYGVSLMNDCKYGHDIKNNVIRLTLLKSATHPDTEQDQGEHEFTYSLLPHEGSWVDADTEIRAYYLNNPLKVEAGKAKEDVYSFLNIDNKYIEVDAVKRSEDGKTLVIRCHEYTGGKQKATITLDAKVKGWQESNLMEKPEGDHFISEAITLEFGPYEVKTVLVEL
ncbi:MAG: alpha-mannosidase [Clostridiales bacterium]|uniref:Alpha-mannosidase n=1 Tax=Zhenhengia yiwuensis TaxID=2763666 RepID=A0A926ED18_9FIRM|nr:alpha-mannosidase [Zhenhengia yiwuensis]MBC8578741.1 alpha-mannosidase [Zhenhengia yiwuensis]MDU6358722.1 alpha-mannosidase [Clostridiales bacterium]